MEDDETGFEIVEQRDADDATAFFMSEVLMKCPKVRKFSPEKLRKAVLRGIDDADRSKLSKAYTIGMNAYRVCTISYSVASMYSNPWVYLVVVSKLLSAAPFGGRAKA
jgi:hypothetical protein